MRLARPFTLVFWMLVATSLAASQQQPSRFNLPQRLDPGLQKLADAYFAAYVHKDAAAINALWSQRSPDRDAKVKQLRDWFVSTSSLLVSEQSAELVESKTTGVTLKLHMRLKPSNEPASEARRAIHTVTCVREEEAWKILSD